MRLLIAIASCGKFRARVQALRDTWIPAVKDMDVRVFLGHHAEPGQDEVQLDVPDDYKHLRHKVQAMFRWAVDQGYDAVFKTDDDVLVLPDRLLSGFIRYDYVGRVRGPSRENDAPRIYGAAESNFCSGFGYWCSRRAAEIVANAPENSDWAEDRFSGNALARAGIKATNDPAMLLWPPLVGHYCSAPNEKCSSCLAQYAIASVICPHRRPETIPVLWKWYLEKGFIPTELPK